LNRAPLEGVARYRGSSFAPLTLSCLSFDRRILALIHNLVVLTSVDYVVGR
jgi:hypothetical protein